MTDIDEIFNDSYERCLKKGDLISRFYAKYVLSNEIVAEKFSHTDMAKQKRMLEASLHMVMALSAVGSLQETRRAYYDEYRFADVFAAAKRAF